MPGRAAQVQILVVQLCVVDITSSIPVSPLGNGSSELTLFMPCPLPLQGALPSPPRSGEGSCQRLSALLLSENGPDGRRYLSPCWPTACGDSCGNKIQGVSVVYAPEYTARARLCLGPHSCWLLPLPDQASLIPSYRAPPTGPPIPASGSAAWKPDSIPPHCAVRMGTLCGPQTNRLSLMGTC